MLMSMSWRFAGGPILARYSMLADGCFLRHILLPSVLQGFIIREIPPQFENRIMVRVYVRSIVQKSSILLAGTGVWIVL